MSADSRLNIDKGFRFDATLKAANDAVFLSDTNMASLELGFKAVLPLTERFRVLTRANLGATYIEDFNALPPSLRFLPVVTTVSAVMLMNNLALKMIPVPLSVVVGHCQCEVDTGSKRTGESRFLPTSAML